MKLAKQLTKYDKVHIANEICNLINSMGYESFWMEDTNGDIIIRMKLLNNNNQPIYITIANFRKDI